uniref:Uncharacterized protein n=1 Tax=viral metagenome TaxID=1070528 RepID=A0A6C0EJ88_9ZZZZ
MPNLRVENDLLDNECCKGLTQTGKKKQCSRKANKEFGDLCGLHNNALAKHGTIERIDDNSKKTKTLKIRKASQESTLITNISIDNCNISNQCSCGNNFDRSRDTNCNNCNTHCDNCSCDNNNVSSGRVCSDNCSCDNDPSHNYTGNNVSIYNNRCDSEDNNSRALDNRYEPIYKGLTELLLNTQTNIVYKEVFEGLIEIGKYNIVDNTINNLI